MWEILTMVLFVVFVAAAIIAGAVLWRNYVDSGAPGAGMFRPKADKRLDIVEQATLDGRRKLVLIRRDGIEHLIMTGGPVDVVIETGIGEAAQKAPARTGEVVRGKVFGRQASKLDKAAGDA